MKLMLNLALVAAFSLTNFQPAFAQADDSMMREIAACQALPEDADRLRCFDQIGKAAAESPAAEAPAPSAPAAAVPAATSSPQLPAASEAVPVAEPAAAPAPAPAQTDEDFGLPKQEEQLASLNARVIRCNKGNDFRWYFYLDNGQVWRYLGSRNLRYRSCNSDAVLQEDSLGFTLRMDDERSHRVKRVR